MSFFSVRCHGDYVTKTAAAAKIAAYKNKIIFRQYMLRKSTDFIHISSYSIRQSIYNRTAEERMHYLDTGSTVNTLNPPVVILLGTAQTIETYSPHISALSKHRRVIIPELRGQGKTQLNTNDASIEQHVADFCNFLKTIDVQ